MLCRLLTMAVLLVAVSAVPRSDPNRHSKANAVAHDSRVLSADESAPVQHSQLPLEFLEQTDDPMRLAEVRTDSSLDDTDRTAAASVAPFHDPRGDPCNTVSGKPCLLPFVRDAYVYRGCVRRLNQAQTHAQPPPPSPVDGFFCPTNVSDDSTGGVFGGFEMCRPNCLYDDEPPCKPRHCRLEVGGGPPRCSARAFNDPACLAANPRNDTLGCECPLNCAAVDVAGVCTACVTGWRLDSSHACVRATCRTLTHGVCSFPFTWGFGVYNGCWLERAGSLLFTYCINATGVPDNCDALCPTDTEPDCGPNRCRRNGRCGNIPWDAPACQPGSTQAATCECVPHCLDMAPVSGGLRCLRCEPGYSVNATGGCHDDTCYGSTPASVNATTTTPTIINAACVFPAVVNNRVFQGCMTGVRPGGATPASANATTTPATPTSPWCFTKVENGVYSSPMDCGANCPTDSQGHCQTTVLADGTCARAWDDPACVAATDTEGVLDCGQQYCARADAVGMCVECNAGYALVAHLHVCLPRVFVEESVLPFCWAETMRNPIPPQPKRYCPPSHPDWVEARQQCFARCPADKPRRVDAVCYAECVEGYVDQHPRCAYPPASDGSTQYKCTPCQYLYAQQNQKPGCDCKFGYVPMVPYTSCTCQTHNYPKPEWVSESIDPTCSPNQTESSGSCYPQCPGSMEPMFDSDPSICQYTCPPGEQCFRLCPQGSSVPGCGKDPDICDDVITNHHRVNTVRVVRTAADKLFRFYRTARDDVIVNDQRTSIKKLTPSAVTSLERFHRLQAVGRALEQQLPRVRRLALALQQRPTPASTTPATSAAELIEAVDGEGVLLADFWRWQDAHLVAMVNAPVPLDQTIDFEFPSCKPPLQVVAKMKYYLLVLFGALTSDGSTTPGQWDPNIDPITGLPVVRPRVNATLHVNDTLPLNASLLLLETDGGAEAWEEWASDTGDSTVPATPYHHDHDHDHEAEAERTGAAEVEAEEEAPAEEAHDERGSARTHARARHVDRTPASALQPAAPPVP